jgi:hypothetical protein
MENLFKGVDLNMAKDKMFFFERFKTTTAFYEILNANQTADSELLIGELQLTKLYLPVIIHFSKVIILRLVASMGKTEEDEINIRSFLGKMIF